MDSNKNYTYKEEKKYSQATSENISDEKNEEEVEDINKSQESITKKQETQEINTDNNPLLKLSNEEKENEENLNSNPKIIKNKENEEENNKVSNKKEVNNTDEDNEKILDDELTENDSRAWHVKLYELNYSGEWDDKDTGQVYIKNGNKFLAKYKNKIDNIIFKEEEIDDDKEENEENEDDKPYLIMYNKDDDLYEEMFNLQITKNMNFNNQRGTIITWKSNDNFKEDNMAISFMDKEGISEIWNLLCILTGKDPSKEILEEDDSNFCNIKLNKNNLKIIAEKIKPEIVADRQRLTSLKNSIESENNNLIKELGNILNEEEKQKEEIKSNVSKETADFSEINFSMNNNKSNNNSNSNNKNDKNNPSENLVCIYNIFKNLLLIGDKKIIETLMNDENYLITFGALEYDPETQKCPKHRLFFKEEAKFKNILNINNQDILDKIHLNNRLLYLRDIAISRFIDENCLKIINSILQLNNNYIIQFFLDDRIYFDTLFKYMKDKNNIQLQTDSLNFLIELMNCTKDLFTVKMTFYEHLVDIGIMEVLESILNDISDLLNDKDNFQKYLNIVEQKKSNENSNDISEINFSEKNYELIRISIVEIIINILTNIPSSRKDCFVTNEYNVLMLLINILLCQENFGLKYGINQIIKSLLDSETSSKLSEVIFDKAMPKLINFLCIPLNNNYKNEMVGTTQIIIEIICNCITQYGSEFQTCIDNNKLNEKVVLLFKNKNKIIDLHVIKYIKCIIQTYDDSYLNDYFSEDLFKKIIEIFDKNKKKNNLIFSALLDLFFLLVASHEKIFNNLLVFNKDFFYGTENKEKYFNSLLNKYEHKDEKGEDENQRLFYNNPLSSSNDIFGLRDEADAGEKLPRDLDEFFNNLGGNDLNDDLNNNEEDRGLDYLQRKTYNDPPIELMLKGNNGFKYLKKCYDFANYDDRMNPSKFKHDNNDDDEDNNPEEDEDDNYCLFSNQTKKVINNFYQHLDDDNNNKFLNNNNYNDYEEDDYDDDNFYKKNKKSSKNYLNDYDFLSSKLNKNKFDHNLNDFDINEDKDKYKYNDEDEDDDEANNYKNSHKPFTLDLFKKLHKETNKKHNNKKGYIKNNEDDDIIEEEEEQENNNQKDSL